MRKMIAWMLFFALMASCISVIAEGTDWICPECGASNTTKFCIKCGTKRPEVIVCPGCGMQYPLDTDVVFCGECGTKLRQEEESSRYEGDGFDTPEEAALCYITGFKNQDFEQILSAFAWETQADHFDYKAFVTRTKGTDPTYVPGMPAANSLLRTAMVEQLRCDQINWICRGLENYVNDELSNSAVNSLSFQTESDLEEYFLRCDNGKMERLAAMKNIRFYTPDDFTEGKFSVGKNPQNFLKQNAKYGADETRNIIIVADIDEDTVVVAPTAARYGDKWYLVSVGSMVQGITGMETNRAAFYILHDETKEMLASLTPVTITADLSVNAGSRIHYEGAGFSTPEDAVECYLEGLKDGNVQKMLSAFAWETQVSHYSLKDYALWRVSINYNSPIRMQFDNPLLYSMNIGSLRYLQSRRIYGAIRNYILEDEDQFKDLIEGYRIDLKTEEDVDAFIRAFDNDKADRLKKLHDIRLIDPATVIRRYGSDSVKKRQEILQRVYGADELKETLVVADLDGETLIFNPVLARYGDKWYIVTVEGTAFFFLSVDVNKMAFMTVDGSFELAMMLLQP